MPDYFAHRIFADNIYNILPETIREKITSKERYLLGAQGCDLYFFYRLSPYPGNIGNRMHGMRADDLFAKLSPGDTSYLLGFCTHYALDSMFHPAVYKYAKVFYLRHAAFETDLGTFMAKTYGEEKSVSSKEDCVAEAEIIFNSIKPVIPKATLKKIERTIRYYQRYSEFLYKRGKNTYRCRYDFESLKALLSDTEKFSIDLIKAVMEGKTDGELFSKSFKEGRPW
ncbi:MAG: zinc dependent phospholipase C family protein [Clostridia bacterium]|nr:zinc dependent phospholipase C family protein [Clostridia bacterium]